MRRWILLIYLMAVFLLQVRAQESVFTDSYLQSLIQEALEANSDLRIASLNMEQAKAQLRSAKLNYLPGFTLAANGSLSKPQDSPATKTYSLPVQMEWELSLGMGQKAERKIAKAQWLSQKEALHYQQIQLVADVANAYYTLIMQDRQIEITKENIRLQENCLEAIRSYWEIGKMNELAVKQQEASLQETSASLLELELSRSQVETALNLLLNRPAGMSSQEGQGAIERASWNQVRSVNLDPTQQVPLEKLRQRPDVLRCEYDLMAACGQLKAAQAQFYPTLRITADGGWTNNLGEIVNPGKLLLNLISGLTQPIFARGTLKARKEVAQAQLKQSEIAFEKALITAGGEVKDALDQASTSMRKQPIRQMQVEACRQAYQNCRDLLEHSQTVTYLDVLSAESSLLMAELQQTADFLEQQQALINLYKALCPED